MDTSIKDEIKKPSRRLSSRSENLCYDSQHVIKSLKDRNMELSNDITVLKRLVYLLNVELESRESSQSKPEAQSDLLDSENGKKYLQCSDIRNIEPLLRSFEQTKTEKDELLSNYKRTFDEFAHRCRKITLENSTLRQQLKEYKEKAHSSMAEWKKLYERFILTEEHNQLLTRQVKLLQNKNQSFETIYRNKLKQLDDEKKELNEKLEQSKTELFLLKGKLSVFSEIKTQPDSRLQPDPTLPSAVMAEMKKLSAELRLHLTKDMQTLKTRVKTLESMKCDLEIRLATVTSERDHLLGYTSAIKSESRQINSKLKMMESELQATRKNEDDARLQVMKSVAFIREFVSSQTLESPRKTLLKKVNPNADNLD